MEPKEWSRKAIVKYGKWRKHSYAGDVSSPKIVRLSRKYLGKRVLDVGAGSGALIERIPGAIGLDLVSKHPRMIRGDISNMPFENSFFDTVFATELLEHLDDETLEQGLGEIKRVLKSGGHFIITTPYNEDLEQNMVLCPNCGAKFHRSGHMQAFDENRIKSILEGKGFEIAKLQVLPIGFMATHRFLKHFRYFLKRFGFLQSNNLFVVAVKR